jgi:hypothetical protein
MATSAVRSLCVSRCTWQVSHFLDQGGLFSSLDPLIICFMRKLGIKAKSVHGPPAMALNQTWPCIYSCIFFQQRAYNRSDLL